MKDKIAKLYKIQTTNEKPYVSHLVFSAHGAGSEFIEGDRIFGSGIVPLFVPEGWNDTTLLLLEEWIDQILNNPTVMMSSQIKISITGVK